MPADDVGDPCLMFWRFETYEDVPVGFGGLELYGDDALLRSVVTLPPLRQIGMGGAIVSALEAEARANNCRTIYLLTASDREFFAKLGYVPCAPADLPPSIRESGQIAVLPDAAAMVKRIG
jgi:N-acetylglutamate synthase-like GNAT family acetyltransferase